MFAMFTEIRWLAVLVAAVAWFVFGALWYMTPAIARAWQRAGGFDVPEDARPNPMVFVNTLVAYAVACVVTDMLAAATAVSSAASGAALGLTVGVGYALTAAAVSAIYDNKQEPVTWFWINGVFNVLGLTLVGVILGAFRAT
ncbi:MAG: DUF1761 domain-containing protein [Nitriliruptoraceae bacterium]